MDHNLLHMKSNFILYNFAKFCDLFFGENDYYE